MIDDGGGRGRRRLVSGHPGIIVDGAAFVEGADDRPEAFDNGGGPVPADGGAVGGHVQSGGIAVVVLEQVVAGADALHSGDAREQEDQDRDKGECDDDDDEDG